MKVADLKQHVTRHLRSARQWLVRAEEDFGKNDNVRGEMNLILAQAELQHLKEAKLKGGFIQSILFRQSFAAFIALALVCLSFGGAYWFVDMHQKNQRINQPIKQEQTAIYQTPKNNVQEVPQHELPIVNKTENDVPAVDQMQTQSNASANPNHNNVAEKQIEVSPTDIQKLVRAAGKTLRGQQ